MWQLLLSKLDMPITVDFPVVVKACDGGMLPIVPLGEECALWCPTLEALPGRVLNIADSRDSAVTWGKGVASRILGGVHIGLLAAEYSKFKVTVRIVVVPTCATNLALEYNDFEADWMHIQDSKGSKVWDIGAVAYVRSGTWSDTERCCALDRGGCWRKPGIMLVVAGDLQKNLRNILEVGSNYDQKYAT